MTDLAMQFVKFTLRLLLALVMLVPALLLAVLIPISVRLR